MTERPKATLAEFLLVIGRERGCVELTQHNIGAAREAESKGLVTIDAVEHTVRGHPYTQRVAILKG